jgi:integrase-like protein
VITGKPDTWKRVRPVWREAERKRTSPTLAPRRSADPTGTLRRDFLNGKTFPDLATAQARISTWLEEYNTDRPHQSLARRPPAERFAAREPTVLPPDLRALASERSGDDWVTRRVASNGVISVAWQQVCVGKHRAGEVVDVHVTGRLLEVWSGNDLIKTIARSTEGGTRKKRASRPAQS